jgi:hypothetical protein
MASNPRELRWEPVNHLARICIHTRGVTTPAHSTSHFFLNVNELETVVVVASEDERKKKKIPRHVKLAARGVQPCRHSPHVATGALNVATGSCSEIDL